MLNWNNIITFAKEGAPKPIKRVEKTEEEWKNILTEETYRVAREKGTERAGSGDYCASYEDGIYACVCCSAPLFDSTIKFGSGTGWPSFTQPITINAIAYNRDVSFGMERVEVVCNSCDAHLGHVFPDGPEPSGLRYCVNSVSIQLKQK